MFKVIVNASKGQWGADRADEVQHFPDEYPDNPKAIKDYLQYSDEEQIMRIFIHKWRFSNRIWL